MAGNRFTFMLVATGVFLSTLDSSMINVALPSIMADLNAAPAEIDLVIITYFMAITCSLMVWGRLADYCSKYRLYFFGIFLFSFFAFCCSLTANIGQLIICRAVQGFGAAVMMAAGPALIKDVFDNRSLGSTYGLIGIATAAGLMLGPAVSGVLLSTFSWHVLFYLPAPFAAVVLVVALSQGRPKKTQRFPPASKEMDLQGGVIWTLFVVSFVLTIKAAAFSTLFAAVALCCSGLLFLLFIKTEIRRQNPILPVYLVQQRFFRNAVIAAALSFSVLFITIVITPFYLDLIKGYNPMQIGKTMMAMPLTLIVFSPLSGWLYDRFNSARIVSTLGLACSASSLLLFWQLTETSSPSYVVACLALLGAGQSIFLTPNSSSVLKRVPNDVSGITSGILATSRNFGMMWGAAMAGSGFSTIYGLVGKEPLTLDSVDSSTFLLSSKILFSLAIVLILTACYFSLTRSESTFTGCLRR